MPSRKNDPRNIFKDLIQHFVQVIKSRYSDIHSDNWTLETIKLNDSIVYDKEIN